MSHTEADALWLRRAIELSRQSVAAGDYAFGAVVVARDGSVVAEAIQTVAKSGDPLGHAEMNALGQLFPKWSRKELAGATLCSTEPCPMCSGAVAWCLNRLVFGLSQASMYALDPEAAPRFEEPWDSRRLFTTVRPVFEAIGPLLEQEAADVHRMWRVANPNG